MSDAARNEYLRFLGAPDPGRYRQPLPGDPTLPDLLPVGSIIRTSYGTGGRVLALEAYAVTGAAGEPLACWTIVMGRPDHQGREREGWLNECVVHGGRILKLFEACDDEVFIIASAAPAPPPYADLPLFAWGKAA